MREGENSHWNCSELRDPSWLFVSERLVESLRLPQVPTLHSQVFLFFRVLLLRMSPQHLTSLWPTMITELVSCRCLSLFRRLVHIWDTTSFLLKIFKKITSRDCAYKCAMDTNWKLTYFHSPDVWFLWWNWVSVGLHCFSCSAVSWIQFLLMCVPSPPFPLLLFFFSVPCFYFPAHSSSSNGDENPCKGVGIHVLLTVGGHSGHIVAKFCDKIYTRLGSDFFFLILLFITKQ